MCGIAGEYQFQRRDASLSRMEKANMRQLSRGPDGEGVCQFDGLLLGHKRLKIFDLSDRAAQPMVDHTLGLALVFNGAIYNFMALRKELEAKGYLFTSDSDTEVLIKAYHAWGKACIARLRGMFAFALWERETGKLILARDRMGIKPLYYHASVTTGFKFASTPQALLEFGDIDISIDKTALYYYLTFHAIPEPLTILSGVKKLAPASIMTVYPDGKTEQERYWNFQQNEEHANQLLTENDWLEATHGALQLATDRQLAADVPVGVLLSGGLDSSLLVALAGKYRAETIQTFSIGFESVNDEPGDEFYYSDKVASHFSTQHHQMFISNKHLADSLGQCVAAMSEPMLSHDNIGFYLLAHEVSKHVKVVLSGQGADEIFAGYHWFQTVQQNKCSFEQSAQIILNQVADCSFSDYQQLVTKEFVSENHAPLFLKQLCKQNGSLNPVDNLMAYESTFALANGPLSRVDNMTMAASLEARVPFLDEAVVDLAQVMPLRHKLPDGGKNILKQLGRQLLPKSVVDRPKGYFPVPALKYIQGNTLELMREVLSAKHVKERGLFNATSIQTMLAHPEAHLTSSGASKLWQIGLLEYWLQQLSLKKNE